MQYSRDYLNKLIAESGLKLGTAKASAITAIIELLDENTLDGLLASIRKDYDHARETAKGIKQEQIKLERLTMEYRNKYNALVEIRTECGRARAELEKLQSAKEDAEFEASISGCLPEEQSRLRAYKAALALGLQQVERPYVKNGSIVEQVIRSASNVAANWQHATENGKGGADNAET